jgi:hypothetical protein
MAPKIKAKFVPKSIPEIRASLKKIFAEIGHGKMLEKPGDSSSHLSIFPLDDTYESQNKDEVIVMIIRKHILTLVPRVLTFLGMLIFPIVLIYILSTLDVTLVASSGLMILGLVIFWYLFTLTFSLQTYIYWYYNVFLVTNQRVVDIDTDYIGASRTSGTSINSVEDISVAQHAFFQNVFDFGNIELQTAGARNEFEMVNVPKPRVIEDTILDLSVGAKK